MKPFLRLGGLILLAAATAFFLHFAYRNLSALPDIAWDAGALLGFAAATVVYCSVVMLGGAIWVLLLRAAGENAPVAKALLAFTLSQFAKYIPGNVAQHLGRVALSRLYGFHVPRVMLVMMLEMGWVTAAACLMALLTVALPSAGLSAQGAQVLPAWQMAAVGLPAVLFPVAAFWAINRWRPGPFRKLIGDAHLALPGVGVLLLCFLLYLLSFVLLGLSTDLLAMGVFGAPQSHLLLLSGATALAWVVGFLAPGAPAGLGVREAVLVMLTEPLLGAGVALGLTVSFRLVSLSGDGLIFLGALLTRRMLRG